MTLVNVNQTMDLPGFFEFIYGDASGYAYLAVKAPDNFAFTQHFFQWPEEKQSLIRAVKEFRGTSEVYYAPALFTQKNAAKENVKGSYVYWVEFDGNTPTPTDIQGIPSPSLRIRSSNEGHEHWYWRSDIYLSPDQVEGVNRSLTYLLHADVSGWDAGQILRPPETINHKRNKQVTVVAVSSLVVSEGGFEGLPEPPPVLDVPLPESIPAVEDVIAIHPFPLDVWKLFRNGAPEGGRSTALMQLGYCLAEMQLTAAEVLSLLLNADERWGKFAKRNDQLRRLNEIVTRAKAKHPPVTQTTENALEALGFKSLLATEVHLEWQWEGFLQKSGYLLLTGPSGVGKTQFALNLSADMALGKNFLEKSIPEPQKVLFFSLEMGLADLKYFVEKLAEAYTEEEQDYLEENLKFIPLGEPLYLADEKVQNTVWSLAQMHEARLIVFDSLGSVSADSLSAETEAKKIMDWNDRFRNRLGVSTAYIHHHRKATGDNKKPNKLADVYGSHYFTSRSTTTLSLWDGGPSNSLTLTALKIRLSAKPEPFQVYRDGRLRFTRKESGITIVKTKASDAELETNSKANPVGALKKSNTTLGGLNI